MKKQYNLKLPLQERYRLIFLYSGIVLIFLALKDFNSTDLFDFMQSVALGSLIIIASFFNATHRGLVWLALLMSTAYGLKAVIQLSNNDTVIISIAMTMVAAIAIVDAIKRLKESK